MTDRPDMDAIAGDLWDALVDSQREVVRLRRELAELRRPGLPPRGRRFESWQDRYLRSEAR